MKQNQPARHEQRLLAMNKQLLKVPAEYNHIKARIKSLDLWLKLMLEERNENQCLLTNR